MTSVNANLCWVSINNEKPKKRLLITLQKKSKGYSTEEMEGSINLQAAKKLYKEIGQVINNINDKNLTS